MTIKTKIVESINILKELGLPKAQQNERSAFALLALAAIKPTDVWENSQKVLIGIHVIMKFIHKHYKKRYAENSRESFRRQTIHQFEQAGLIVKNPDNPARATNSGNTVYCITDEALATIKAYNSNEWNRLKNKFLREHGSLLEKYTRPRMFTNIPLYYDGEAYQLSPGKHNLLQIAIIQKFAAIFAQGAELLYFGDTAQKTLIVKKDLLETLGIPITEHTKLPDVILYLKEKNWLYLIEAVTSHGPVSPKRYMELEKTLEKSTTDRIYVSAFPDFHTFARYSKDIAWETEVWIADNQTHLIHFNGDKFFGPRTTNIQFNTVTK
ncbi:MAG: restriction endonuclease [Bacteroidales bacterium]|jgi:adenine-specific DNA-methyltransferase|nr:restriction endonuclease [Bacteroidales bacterium]